MRLRYNRDGVAGQPGGVLLPRIEHPVGCLVCVDHPGGCLADECLLHRMWEETVRTLGP
jgi:hypothetical protein